MWLLILFPFCLQAVVITFDEAYFHLKRGLPRFERIGHPIDTLSVVACFAFVLLVPFSAASLKVYIALSLFSCLLVTKDEFIHKHHCPAAEHWLHALLFLNHPILLTALGLIWPLLSGSATISWLISWQEHLLPLQIFIYAQALFALIFMLYQTIYWNFIWEE
jgi:hypothetical protein